MGWEEVDTHDYDAHPVKHYISPQERERRSQRSRKKVLEQWKDPAYRAKQLLRKRSRAGVPNGMTRAEAQEHWAVARAKTETIFGKLVEAGIVKPIDDENFEKVVLTSKEGTPTEVYVPVTDEGKASLALKECVLAMLSPMTNQTEKQAARRTVLEYTKPKPAQKIEAKLSHEEFLERVVADLDRDGGKSE